MKKIIYVLTVLLMIGILAGCNSTDVPTVPETDSNTADTSVATDIGKTAAAEVGSNSAQITEKAPETAAESNTASGIGGVFNCYRAKYCFEYGTIPFELEDNGVLAPGEIKQWLITERGFSETLNSVGADKSDILLGIIEYFNIPKEKFPVDKFLTQERVDALYSKDRSKINEAFVSPHAIYKNGEIYSPEWLDTHTLEEINAVGITLEDIAKKIETDWYIDMNDTERFEFVKLTDMGKFGLKMMKLCDDNGVPYTVPSTN